MTQITLWWKRTQGFVTDELLDYREGIKRKLEWIQEMPICVGHSSGDMRIYILRRRFIAFLRH